MTNKNPYTAADFAAMASQSGRAGYLKAAWQIGWNEVNFAHKGYGVCGIAFKMTDWQEAAMKAGADAAREMCEYAGDADCGGHDAFDAYWDSL